MWEYFTQLYFSSIFVMIINDCHSHSNCANPLNHSVSDTNFKNLELVCQS